MRGGCWWRAPGWIRGSLWEESWREGGWLFGPRSPSHPQAGTLRQKVPDADTSAAGLRAGSHRPRVKLPADQVFAHSVCDLPVPKARPNRLKRRRIIFHKRNAEWEKPDVPTRPPEARNRLSRSVGRASGGAASRVWPHRGGPGGMLVFAAARLTQGSACEQSRQDGEGLRTFLYVFYTTMNKSESKLCWAAEAANPQQGWGRGRGVAGSDPRRKAGPTHGRRQGRQRPAYHPPPQACGEGVGALALGQTGRDTRPGTQESQAGGGRALGTWVTRQRKAVAGLKGVAPMQAATLGDRAATVTRACCLSRAGLHAWRVRSPFFLYTTFHTSTMAVPALQMGSWRHRDLSDSP